MRRSPSNFAPLAYAAFGFLSLAVVLLVPVSLHPARYARLDGDSQFSIWNVGWVAHALLTDPLGVWDANIFFPAQMTLAYSEANLFSGLLAAPVLAATGSAVAAHNVVLVLSFVLSALAMFGLVRYLTRDSRAAAIAAISFGFCPFVFAHLSHIQLLMTGGLPLALLCFHRLADGPSPRRGVELGLVMAVQTYACAYYGIFAVLLVGFAALAVAWTRRAWRELAYWRSLAVAAVVGAMAVVPLVWPYVVLARETGFARPLDEARAYSAMPTSYLASAAYAHNWLLALLPAWRDVLFPGFTAVIFGVWAIVTGWRGDARRRELTVIYAGLAILAAWASLGPDAGLYALLYRIVPGFGFLRAPARFGVLVQLSLSALAGIALAALFAHTRRPVAWLAVVGSLVLVESVKPVKVTQVPPVSTVYHTLATLPRAGVIELPLYSRRFAFVRTKYMLASTSHWQPLVGGYSDYIPDSFVSREPLLGDFPTEASLNLLAADGVRYAVFHAGDYSGEARTALASRLAEFGGRLELLDSDHDTLLYEIKAAGSHPR
jgi:hypothetical protein